jgi:hypothetical protein
VAALAGRPSASRDHSLAGNVLRRNAASRHKLGQNGVVQLNLLREALFVPAHMVFDFRRFAHSASPKLFDLDETEPRQQIVAVATVFDPLPETRERIG